MKRKKTTSRKSAKARSSNDDLTAIARLQESARRGELVAVVGTGVSITLTNGKRPSLSWAGLIRDGFAYAARMGKITAEQAKAWECQLGSSDIDDLLCAAEFVSRKLEAPSGSSYARWLQNVFKSVKPANPKMEAAVRALKGAGVPICTLNYDALLEQVTGLEGINLTETEKVISWMRRDTGCILHLHGVWGAPATCVLGIRDYETTLGNEVRDRMAFTLA